MLLSADVSDVGSGSLKELPSLFVTVTDPVRQRIGTREALRCLNVWVKTPSKKDWVRVLPLFYNPKVRLSLGTTLCPFTDPVGYS